MGTGEPRVWSPLQGCAPWALKRIAPLGLTPPPSKATQGLVALTGLRTLGFEKGRPAGAYPAAVESPQGLGALHTKKPYKGDPPKPWGYSIPKQVAQVIGLAI